MVTYKRITEYAAVVTTRLLLLTTRTLVSLSVASSIVSPQASEAMLRLTRVFTSVNKERRLEELRGRSESPGKTVDELSRTWVRRPDFYLKICPLHQ